MILIYAFSNHWGTNISRRTLSELQNLPFFKGRSGEAERDFDFQLIYFHPRDFFRKFIEHQSYSLILGLGDYYGNSDKIHIETQAKNSYDDQSIYPFSPILLDLSLPPVDNFDGSLFKISSSMGTYNCNWIAYRTQLYLDQKHLSTYHLFLHLPRRSNANNLAQAISNLLRQNHLISS